MREILFRGKRMDNGEWIYGHFFSDGDVATILPPTVLIGADFGGWWIDDRFELVYPETVGQFTGLTDKNGAKVFEGDIFKTRCSIGVIRFREDQSTFGFEIWWRGFPDDFATFYELGKPEFTIIGNVHDNPELLEVN